MLADTLIALNNKEIAMIGLHFTNAENLELYLGEFSITRGAVTVLPNLKLL